MKLDAAGSTDGRPVERAAFTFYAIAALGSSIGQIWVGVVTPPWPPAVPWWLRAIAVLPFAVVLDLGGVVTAAFADWRQRTGERAYGWRVLSAVWIAVGVGINIVGHADTIYLAVVFGALGSFAYAVWLMHAGSRRRDALRAAGKLDDTAPSYGIWQWRREPEVTARARVLALEHGYRRLESLRQAREQLRDERRDRVLQQLLIRQIKAQHDDSVLASIAATTAPVESLAAELTARFDSVGWVGYLADYLRAPDSKLTRSLDAPSDAPHDQPEVQQLDSTPPAHATDAASGLVNGVDNDNLSGRQDAAARGEDTLREAALVPTTARRYARWRALWHESCGLAAAEVPAFAQRNSVSLRTMQRIRQAGEAGLLDEEVGSPAQRNRLHLVNGHRGA